MHVAFAKTGHKVHGLREVHIAIIVAMNQEHGHFFNVKDEEIYEPGARAQYGPPADLFVFDDQTHMIRTTQSSPQSLRALAQGPGPASTAAG